MSHIMNLTAYDTHKHSRGCSLINLDAIVFLGEWLCLRGEKHIRRFPFWRPFCFTCLVPAVCYWGWVAGDFYRIKQSYNPIWQVWGFF
uniref:Uncharacterized protein n=1 Tax=Pan troglodytes TaxID=9598 RepID=G2HIQ1_PANTR|nr:hypothetical protein [Pan troglodytes]